jgi:predicted O-methyltransferase YrrM
MIPTFVLDSSKAVTDLCLFGAQVGADKSPYNMAGHRHPYTGLYSILLASQRYKPIHFGEIGVAMGASVHLWRTYFPDARLEFFDRDENFLANAKGFGYSNTHFHKMDVNSCESIQNALTESGELFDVLLDDSSHNVNDQKNIVKTALPFIKSGGLLLIEDVFRAETDKAYLDILEPVKDQISFFAFFLTEHTNRFSPGWDNDKVLMIVKK